VEIPRTLEEVCDPARMALLVYDMQVGVVNQIADAAEVTARVLDVLEAARGAGVAIFFTRHMSLPKELMGVAQLRTAMEWQRVDTAEEVKPAFLRDSPEFELIPELEPRPSEAIIDKITMSAFAGTPLDIALRDRGLGAYAIVGVAIEVGIEPTVRHSMDLGYYPVIVADACGSGNREAGERSLAALAFTGSSLQTDSAAFRATLS
jgi:nicotinamidase-related amidase